MDSQVAILLILVAVIAVLLVLLLRAKAGGSEVAAIAGHAQSFAQSPEQTDAARFVADVARQGIFGRGGLAEVVSECGEAHLQ